MSGGLFTDDSMVRRVHRERVVALSGPRALLMQAAHPLAVTGLLAHSSALDEPYERLARTAEIMDTITFGSAEQAERITRRVRSMHSRVNGELGTGVGAYPKGTPYAASDPDLLLWVLFSLVDSALVVYRSYVGRLTRAEEAAFWQDYKVIGELFGLDPQDMPDTLDDLDAYRREMLEGDKLHVNEWARERAREIVLEPPVPIFARPLVQAVNFVTITLLPERIRREYGFRPVAPMAVRRGVTRVNAEYLKRAVVPFMPSRLRLVPSARDAA